MNSTLKLVSAALAVVLLSACSSTHYKITLRDGRDFTTASKPEYSAKTGYYKYRDLHGKNALVRADEVLFVNEL